MCTVHYRNLLLGRMIHRKVSDTVLNAYIGRGARRFCSWRFLRITGEIPQCQATGDLLFLFLTWWKLFHVKKYNLILQVFRFLATVNLVKHHLRFYVTIPSFKFPDELTAPCDLTVFRVISMMLELLCSAHCFRDFSPVSTAKVRLTDDPLPALPTWYNINR